jgi:hypothetical protein
VQKPYDKISNHKAVLIGTHTNAYIHCWAAERRLFQMSIYRRGLASRTSLNGSSTLPNLGLNIPAFSLGLRYGPLKNPTLVKQTPDATVRKNALHLFTTLGSKQFPWIEGSRYLVNTLQVEWSRQFLYERTV